MIFKIKSYKLDLDTIDKNKITINTKNGVPLGVFFNPNGELFVNILHNDLSNKDNIDYNFYIHKNNEEINQTIPLKYIGQAIDITSISDVRLIRNLLYVFYEDQTLWVK